MSGNGTNWHPKKTEQQLSPIGADIANALDALRQTQGFAQSIEDSLVVAQQRVEQAYTALEECE